MSLSYRSFAGIIRIGLLALAVGTAATAISARAATVPGSLGGQLSVGESGGANYSIPIQVPPGVAGMQPELSLQYSSHSGNGLLGVGWQLGGLSSIHRCGQTIAQDGVLGGVNFDTGDRYCIDGQRLIAVAGVYGADGTEYRTEINNVTKVVSHGQSGSGPASWEAWTKSGQRLEFGNTDDARAEAAGRSDVRLWALNRIEDAVGNYLSVTYAEVNSTGQHFVQYIHYAGNDSAVPSTAPDAYVHFRYTLSGVTRNDELLAYQAGSPVTVTNRLDEISVFESGAHVHTYTLGYHETGEAGISRLTSVTLCATDGDCQEPTSFSWKTNATAPAHYSRRYFRGNAQ